MDDDEERNATGWINPAFAEEVAELQRRFGRDPSSPFGIDDPEDADELRLDELVPTGGTWGALLFENPTHGVDRQLTWTFTFTFREVDRSAGSSDVSLSVDWVHLPRCSWRAMSGLAAAGSIFAEPIEPSVHFFEHHRFDAVEVRVVEQQDRRLRVAARVHGDIDALGVDEISVDEWLDFAGIRVSLDNAPRSVRKAKRILGSFTDVEDLAGSSRSGIFDFA